MSCMQPGCPTRFSTPMMRCCTPREGIVASGYRLQKLRELAGGPQPTVSDDHSVTMWVDSSTRVAPVLVKGLPIGFIFASNLHATEQK